MSAAFYLRDGDRYVSTELTRGPWSNDHQHGGPPCALIARALERLSDDAGANGDGRASGTAPSEFVLARLTVEILRPIPIAPLTVRAQISRPGKSVQRLEAVLSADGTELARATGLRVKRRALALPEGGVSTPAPDVPAPEGLPSFEFPFFQHEVGYHRAVELRFARGAWGERDVVVWARPTAALIEGEPLTPTDRVLIIVDAESGICPPLAPGPFTFVNPDLTVYFERPLRGDWLGLAVRSSAHAHGVGIAESLLFDTGGPIGRGAQSLCIAAR